MKKKQPKRNTKPRFILPGEDSKRVQWLAFAEGLYAQCRVLFKDIPVGEYLPWQGQCSVLPRESSEIDAMADGISTLVLGAGTKKQPVTNEPAVFYQIYREEFLRGYRFSLYALSRLVPVLDDIADNSKRYEVVSQFAYEMVMGEPAVLHNDELTACALEEIQSIYKQYRSLN